MAFSLGMISYTISRLVSGLKPDLDKFVDDLNSLNLTNQNDQSIFFDDKKIAELFEQKNPLQDQTVIDLNDKKAVEAFEKAYLEFHDTKKVENSVNIEKVKETEIPEDVYENFVVTEYFLKYNQDFGDMYNLRSRNNFVEKYAKTNKKSKERSQLNDEEKNDLKRQQKLKQKRAEEKRLNNLQIQQRVAEQYTKLIDQKD